jgi:1,4-dihydroxy-2-naphthoate polyprenyltransferase
MLTGSMVRAFLRLSRPLFLLGGVVLLAVGVLDAGSMQVGRWVTAQAMVTLVQLTAHYVNEFADVEADTLVENRTIFSGGSGVLSSGILDPKVALRAALTTSGLAAVPVVILALDAPLAALLGVVALLVSWTYSMPPLRLLATGFGEVLTSITVAGMVPLVGALAMGAIPSVSLWRAIAALVMAHMAMMLTFELPDLDTDRSAGKTVLAVRVGRVATERVVLVLHIVGCLVALAAGSSVASLAAAAGMVAVSRWAVTRRLWSVATGGGVAVLVLMALALVIARASS